jgi:hypothetical protein
MMHFPSMHLEQNESPSCKLKVPTVQSEQTDAPGFENFPIEQFKQIFDIEYFPESQFKQ